MQNKTESKSVIKSEFEDMDLPSLTQHLWELSDHLLSLKGHILLDNEEVYEVESLLQRRHRIRLIETVFHTLDDLHEGLGLVLEAVV